jgi:hypothetical protein
VAALPADFDATLGRIKANGILEESPDQINHRLQLALNGVGAMESASDLGAFDWAARLVSRVKKAIYNEICDEKKGCLNEKYQKLLNAGMTEDGVKAVAGVVTPIITAISPGFAISAVVIYVSLWLLKIGLGTLCARPMDAH